MKKVLMEMENAVLTTGREWTRKRLEETLQKAADAIAPVCSQSGLVLKDQKSHSFTLMTTSGTVSIRAIRGRSSATGGWHCPGREQWGLDPHHRPEPGA